MHCKKIQKRLQELVFGLLDDRWRLKVERHLEKCDACGKAYKAVLRERELLKCWDAPPTPVGLVERTLAAARAAGEGGETPLYAPAGLQPGWLGVKLAWAISGAAALLLCAFLTLQWLWVSGKKADPQEAILYGQGQLTPGLPAIYRVFVRNGATFEPVPDAHVRVQLVPARGKPLVYETRTDIHGIALVQADLPEDLPEGEYELEVLASSEQGKSKITPQVEVKRSYRVMVSTDKPLYQPGQTIHIRTLALAMADLRPVAGHDIVIEVQDAKGNKVFKRTLQTSAYGIASADFPLADQLNTGAYTVSAILGDTTSEQTVTVEHYVLPKFKVDISTDRSFYMPSEVIQGDLAAEYTFGKPVAGAKVSVVASEFIEAFRPFASVTGQTDENGAFHFAIALKEHFIGQEVKKGDALVTLEATVTDAAGHVQKKNLDLTLTGSPIRIEFFPESGTLVQNVENILYIVTTYPDGRPAKTKLIVGATKEVVETASTGIAKVKITPRTKELQLTVTAKDERGVTAVLTRQLRIGERTDGLLLRTDRVVYRAGETVDIRVISADPAGRVFLDMVKDRRTMLMTALELRDGKGTFALDLPSDLFGTLELHAYRVGRDGSIVGDTKLVQVNRAEELSIDAKLDKETYLPGERALLNFAVARANGDPVLAALSLAAVDEAVFALQETRPGLERIYFMLQEELLKPRYEIHARLPLTPQQAAFPESEPTRDLEEAAVVLFSSAEGSDTPGLVTSESFALRQEWLEREKEEHLLRLVNASWEVPFLLFLFLTLPTIFYGASRLFWRTPAIGPEKDMNELRRAVRRFMLWWGLGVSLPFLVPVLVAGVADVAELFYLYPYYYYQWEESFVVPAGLGVGAFFFVVLAFSGLRLSALSASRIVPALRGCLMLLPWAYFSGWLGAMVFLLYGYPLGEYWREYWVDEMFGFLSLLAIPLLGWITFAAIGLAHMSAIGRVSPRPRVSVARVALVLCGLVVSVIIGVLFMPAPAVRRSREQRSVITPAALEEMWAASTSYLHLASEPGRPVTDATVGEAPVLKAPARIRRYFPETLLWRPELITDEAGRAELEVPLADSITTWRVSASAVSQAGELGATTRNLSVFQDFFVDLDMPVSLTQHDIITVPVAVYNYLDKPQTLRVELEPHNWYEALEDSVKVLEVGAREIASAHFTIRAKTPGRHPMTVKAYGTEMADAVARQVRVVPDGREIITTVNGRLTEERAHEIVIPKDAIEGASDLYAKIYPGAFSQVLEGLDGIFQMPYGCFEQTSSITYPNVLVLDYLRRTKQAKPDVERKALSYIGLGYQRLLSYEVKGGGFEWFGHAPADTVLTAYGLMEFGDMSRVFEVDPGVIDRTREWLFSKQERDGSWVASRGHILEGVVDMFDATLFTTAYIAWALGESGKIDSCLNRALDYVALKGAQSQDAYTLALCANALVAARRREAQRFLELLESKKQVEKNLVHWSSTSQGVTFSCGEVLDVETTALAAYAFLRAGVRTDTAHRALTWLIERKDPRGTWYSTQATVHAMRALLAGTRASRGEGEIKVSISANGELAEEIIITPDTMDVLRLVSLRPFVRKGTNTVSLESAGKGDLAYQIVAIYYAPRGEEVPEAEREMTIDVQYDTTTIRKDDTVTCTVKIRYNRPGVANMTIVDLGIPPGFEVMTDGFEALQARGLVQRFSVTGGQVILYFRELPGQETVTFTYQLRARFPVKVKAPPSVVYQYYEPKVRDETLPVELTVL